MTYRTQTHLTSASMLLYLASMPFNTLCQAGSCSAWPAFSVLIFGALPLFSSPANFAWLANPALFVSWAIFAIDEERSSLNIRIGLALFSAVTAIFPLIFRWVVMNEGGISFPIEGFGIGYWLWLVAMMVNLIAAVGLTQRQDNSDTYSS